MELGESLCATVYKLYMEIALLRLLVKTAVDLFTTYNFFMVKTPKNNMIVFR